MLNRIVKSALDKLGYEINPIKRNNSDNAFLEENYFKY